MTRSYTDRSLPRSRDTIFSPEGSSPRRVDMTQGEETRPNQCACLGTLFYSQSRLAAGRSPLCAGLSRRRTHPAPVSSSETMPSGDFKFVCLGYSVFDPEELRKSSRSLKPGDPVDVPFCSGLEIISASAVSSQRELLSADGQPVKGRRLDRPSADQDASLRRHHADKRKTISPTDLPLRGPDWEGFSKRFVRHSNAIVDKMQANARYMARSVEKTFDQIFGKGQ